MLASRTLAPCCSTSSRAYAPTAPRSRVQVRVVASGEQRQQLPGISPRMLQQAEQAGIPSAALLAAVAAPLLSAEPALAIGREYGILEGRIFSLAHPAVMGFLFVASLYAAYLGFKWRETRTIPDTIKDLKAQLPPADAEGNRPASQVETQIKELEETRKGLIKEKFNDRHTKVGNVLLGAGVLFSVAGPVNTWMRTGKLFPGPHLWAGAAITVLWAVAASLTDEMKKGNEAARNMHIALNCVNIALFAWQVPTGLDIVGKVLQFTTLP